MVIHTERPEEDWWASYSTTIGKFFEHRQSLTLPPHVADIFATMDEILIQCVMNGLDKESAVSAYRRNNEKVPNTDFPRSNARDEFWALLGREPVAA